MRLAFATARDERRIKKGNKQTIKDRLQGLLDSDVPDATTGMDQLNTIVDEALLLEVDAKWVYKTLKRMNWGRSMVKQRVDWSEVVKQVKTLRNGAAGQNTGLGRI